jgi:hypothetical protein
MFIFIKANPIKILQENNTIIDLITFSILSLFVRWMKLYKKNINEEVIRKYRNDDISIESTLNKFNNVTYTTKRIKLPGNFIFFTPFLIRNFAVKYENKT